jgi:hypothetical protein
MAHQKQTKIIERICINSFRCIVRRPSVEYWYNNHLHLFKLVSVRLPPAAADGQPEQDGGCYGSCNDDQCACVEEISKFGGKFGIQYLAGNLNLNANLPLKVLSGQIGSA